MESIFYALQTYRNCIQDNHNVLEFPQSHLLVISYLFVTTDEILEKIKEAGFTVAMQKEMQLTKEQAEEFYSEHREEAYFEELTTRMSRSELCFAAFTHRVITIRKNALHQFSL